MIQNPVDEIEGSAVKVSIENNDHHEISLNNSISTASEFTGTENSNNKLLPELQLTNNQDTSTAITDNDSISQNSDCVSKKR